MSETGDPKVIAFEGAPLAGKTTQVELLQEHLENDGFDVEVMKRMTDECPTREEINRLREKSDGFTRELDEITVEEETELWAQYYREKSDVIESREEPDYILVDRYFLSLIPVQEPAYEDKSLEELVEGYKDEVESVNVDMTVVLILEEGFPERYQDREGREIPDEFLQEVRRIQKNYGELSQYFDGLEYVDGGTDRKKVHDQIVGKLEERRLV